MARKRRKAGWKPDPKVTAVLQHIADSLPLDEVCRRLALDPAEFADPDRLPWSTTPPPQGDPRWEALLQQNALLRRVVAVQIGNDLLDRALGAVSEARIARLTAAAGSTGTTTAR